MKSLGQSKNQEKWYNFNYIFNYSNKQTKSMLLISKENRAGGREPGKAVETKFISLVVMLK